MDWTFVQHPRVDQCRVKSGEKRVVYKLTAKQRVASKVYNLSLDVSALQQQLHELELHWSCLQTRAQYNRNQRSLAVTRITEDYWTTFARGYQAEDPRQRAFLDHHTVSSSRLAPVDALGSLKLLTQWESYSDYFATRLCVMHSVRVVVSDDTTRCRLTRSEGQFVGSLTSRGLQMIFPAVLSDAQLIRRLLGREMKVPVAVILHFNADDKWMRHDTEADWLRALAGALEGDIFEAASVLQHANLSDAMTARHPGHVGDRERRTASSTKRKRPWYCIEPPVDSW